MFWKIRKVFYLGICILALAVVVGNGICLTTPYCPNPHYDAQWYKVALAVFMLVYSIYNFKNS